MNISKFNKPFSSNTRLYASQLNDITDAIDYLIDNLGSNLDNPDNPNDPDPVNPNAGKAVAEKITIDDWNALTTKDPDKIYVVVSNDGITVIGIGISGVLTTIPVPASGEVVTLTQVQYDSLNPKVATTLYFIEQNGVIVKAYLGDKELTLNSDTLGIIKSQITEMFSLGFEWETVNGETKLKSISISKINVDNPGEFLAWTGFEDYVKNTVKEAGFISKTDNTLNFSEMYAMEVGKDSTIAKRASIIASINQSNETNVKINAEKIHLEGYVTADQIDATKAEIKQAVIGDIEAGNVTVTGDLHYNRIIGNTAQVSTNTQLGDNAYFVQVTNNDYNNYITVTLPSNPITGQTIFIGGTKYYNLTANKQIHVYYREIVSEENYKLYLRTGIINVGESQNAFDAGWEGYVEFIYTGLYWQQLIHNISIA